MKPLWQPTTSVNTLRIRANLLTKTREFFAQRDVLEVETPILSQSATPDPHIESFFVEDKENRYYLHTSPEYPMKRLLASGSGSIYQITKVFRKDEIGRLHNPEFTMLEWYRLDMDYLQLMEEIELFLNHLLGIDKFRKLSYYEVFKRYIGIDIQTASIEDLQTVSQNKGLTVNTQTEGRSFYLDLILSHCITPHLGHAEPVFVYDFPSEQAALARIKRDNPDLSERFELFINGMELANGFSELTDPDEQRKRLNQDNERRLALNRASVPVDENFISALNHGLPNCAGVALGFDRLVMLATQSSDISKVIALPFDRA